MISYIEQIQILRDVDRDKLTQLVNDFSIGRCIKKVQYYIHPNTDIVDNFEVYIWYTLPAIPTIQFQADLIGSYGKLTITVNSDIAIQLKEVGILYNTTGIFSEESILCKFPSKYGISSIELNSFLISTTYYFKPYIITCMGIGYGDILTIYNN
jgi:hypothetical protein